MRKIRPKVGHIYEAEVMAMSGITNIGVLKFEGMQADCGHRGCQDHKSVPMFKSLDKSSPIGSVQNISILREVTDYRPELPN